MIQFEVDKWTSPQTCSGSRRMYRPVDDHALRASRDRIASVIPVSRQKLKRPNTRAVQCSVSSSFDAPASKQTTSWRSAARSSTSGRELNTRASPTASPDTHHVPELLGVLQQRPCRQRRMDTPSLRCRRPSKSAHRRPLLLPTDGHLNAESDQLPRPRSRIPNKLSDGWRSDVLF
jgi:hypothetical protein